MITWIIIISVGVCIATLVGSVAVFMQRTPASNAEERLSAMSEMQRMKAGKDDSALNLLTNALDESTSWADKYANKFGDIQGLLDQAGVPLTPGKFFLLSMGLGAVASVVVAVFPFTRYFAPLAFPIAGVLPYMFLLFRRSMRLKKFSSQLPEALDLLGRSLRSGYSLGAGIGLCAEELPAPLGPEFARAFDEQNFGVPLEETLDSMTKRVPNVDLRFFATAVTLQRQTGGDLAEILDKLSRLIRERFKLAGQIQALTGEGRLSGVVLLALAPGLFVVMYFLNKEYTMVLIDDPTGRKLMAGALFLQFLGAMWIKKIINVQV
jgi:tight adherence protein B